MIEAVALVAFLEATVRLAVPLGLSALGESISERAGVLNLGLEGAIISGALAGALGAIAFGNPYFGVVLGALAGAFVGAVFALFAVVLNTNQIITGTAVTLGGIGFTAVIYQARFGPTGATLQLPTLETMALPGLSSIPVIGSALFNQAPTTYLMYLLAPLLWWLVFRTRWGLELRAAGEAPTPAASSGVRVKRVRVIATILGSALAGIAGAHLALTLGTFQVNMSAGRGFIAIAVVVLGRWNPMGVVLASIFFGAASALQFLLQSMGFDVPYQLLLALPYVLTLAALAGWIGRARAPSALALPWPRR